MQQDPVLLVLHVRTDLDQREDRPTWLLPGRVGPTQRGVREPRQSKRGAGGHVVSNSNLQRERQAFHHDQQAKLDHGSVDSRSQRDRMGRQVTQDSACLAIDC